MDFFTLFIPKTTAIEKLKIAQWNRPKI